MMPSWVPWAPLVVVVLYLLSNRRLISAVVVAVGFGWLVYAGYIDRFVNEITNRLG